MRTILGEPGLIGYWRVNETTGTTLNNLATGSVPAGSFTFSAAGFSLEGWVQ